MKNYVKHHGVQLLIWAYLFSVIFLFFYSFTQVDLGLALSRSAIAQSIVKSFQYIGYFNRPLSTVLYYIILFLLFSTYIGFIIAAQKNMISRKTVWKLIISSSVLLVFSYNAFSYDIFNYMFDARIVTFYHQNPYFHRALDFPHDHMLAFMHWTQRTYPYGPFWLVITIPLSVIGLQLFLLTFFIFKALAVVSYVLTAYFIEKIAKKFLKEQSLFVLILYCFNPLVIIESLVSGHIDAVMMCLSIMSTYFLLNQKNYRSLFLFIISIGIKYATAFLLPAYMYVFYSIKRKREVSIEMFFLLSTILLTIAVVFESVRTNFQPWYLLAIIPYGVFTGRKLFMLVITIIFPLFALLEYAPFLSNGNWNPPIPLILNILTVSGIILSIVIYLVIKGISSIIVLKSKGK